MDKTYGYKNQKGDGLSHEILASSNFEMISITIDTAVRDTGNASDPTSLRRGLVLVHDAASKKYINMTVATESPTAIVLGENVPGIDAGDTVAKAFYKASFKKGVLIDASGTLDLDQVQRISVRDNV